jgi:PHD/YefM family antitoxin component YafN of YafNO toxin-antitoxin module
MRSWREPVTVTAGAGAAVVLSADAYARLRGEALTALRATLGRTRAYAASQGLTEAELDRLLADENGGAATVVYSPGT